MLTKKQIINDSDDQFMNDEQLAFMRQLLINMRERTLLSSEPIVAENHPEAADCAAQEERWLVAIKSRVMQADLLSEIDKALVRIESKEYGYCERSGEPIDIRRLLAYPTSSLTVQEQAIVERRQTVESHCTKA